jgi:catechol 2,3-dioxygenase-like lactoylglutathione lyase family enzyme
MINALNDIEVITLFVEDVTETKEFYRDVFGSIVVFEDSNSAVMQFKHILVNLLKQSEATTLVKPIAPGDRSSGVRMLFTIKVENVNTTCTELEQHNIPILSGPKDQPWGRRTATFADPSGNVWEIAQELKQ